ncbi:mitochondrial inner membrane protein OXA1L [Melopsittacus undulatus]|uniref:mitochondrial inner membrane protein OXA1L n=1 Tax=Melopsittacus undulatus TaxID=13146 RepID=UPI00146D700E|nr:mitochondrial inner membrane protein OXA1L [Melopsittacus undulatus]
MTHAPLEGGAVSVVTSQATPHSPQGAKMAAMLRVVRLQALRGPPWPWRPPVGPAAARRGLAGGGAEPGLTAPIAPMGPSPPLMGQTPPAPPPSPPLVGQDPSLIAPSPSLLPPSPPAAMGQDPLSMGQSMGLAPHAMGPGAPEVRLEELGLGACTPVGLVQNFLQFLHLDVGLPWWGAIAAGTLCVRVALLPLLLRAQREAAVLALHTPRLQQLSKGLAQARRGSDQREVARAYTELVGYQQRHNLNPLRGFLVPLVQTPVFVSFFLALQGMAAAPVPGLQWGGLGWFQDLSAPDPYYLLPVLVTASMGLVLELGAETGVSSPGGGAMRQLLRLLPLICLPFILHFPTAIFTYWLTSNSFSLLHVALLRVPALRARLGLPPPVKGGGVTPGGGGEKKGLIARMKQEWREAQALQQGEQRQWRQRHHLDMAAKGPLRQTFASNPLAPPTPPPPPPLASQAAMEGDIGWFMDGKMAAP